MFAFRNRPPQLQDVPGVAASPSEVERAERIGNMSQELGMAPAVLAGKVVDAISSQQFYILTHDHFDPTIRARMEDILERRTPTPYRSEIDVDAR